MPKLNSPLPQPLQKECVKATKIFQSFVDSRYNSLDGVVPRNILADAKGFAIFTIFKAGFIFSARAGSGVVIAKLNDGTWSAPSAIGTAGVGVGTQAGAEMTDFLVVLNSRSAVSSFMSAGSVTLGGNVSIALGPLGRNGEATGSVNTNGKVAAMYSYSKTRGLFGGVSLEGSVIVERHDANALAYNSPVTARMLLGGMVDRPDWAVPLINALETYTGPAGTRDWIEEHNRHTDEPYVFGDLGQRAPSMIDSPSSSSFFGKKKKEEFPPASWSTPPSDDTYSTSEEYVSNHNSLRSGFGQQFDSNFDPIPSSSNRRRSHQPSSANIFASPSTHNSHTRSNSLYTPVSRTTSEQEVFDAQEEIFAIDRSKSLSHKPLQTKPELRVPLSPSEGVARAVAMYDFKAAEPGDLSFAKGDVIVITQKSGSTDDWWTGKLNGRKGIFPANFVEVV